MITKIYAEIIFNGQAVNKVEIGTARLNGNNCISAKRYEKLMQTAQKMITCKKGEYIDVCTESGSHADTSTYAGVYPVKFVDGKDGESDV